MTQLSWQLLAETPWWLYAALFYLVVFALHASKPAIIPIKQLFALPLIFACLSVAILYSTVKFSWFSTCVWGSALIIGYFLGWLQYKALQIKGVRNEKKLFIPGTWGSFILILTFIAIIYFINLHMEIDPLKLVQAKYVAQLMFIYGLFTGMFLGRLSYAVQRVKRGPYADEKELRSVMKS